ncbi:MAG TPA: DUF3467 domain-containing protein [Myxococcota bacterium]|jgi:hypothetical protein|nr:DUF3467 domain-containing protein [Myxococcota bacterium]
MPGPAKPPAPPVPVKARDEILAGVYSNNMFVAHTREEFVMDFLANYVGHSVLNARVVTSPGHMKRIARALADNIAKYEAQYGPIPDPVAAKKPGKIVVN